jgi:hypothetical protein
MSTSRDPVAAGVRALRDLTSEPADGRASRARVLERAAGQVRRRRRLGFAAAVAGLALVLPAASAAIVHLTKTAWRAGTPLFEVKPRLLLVAPAEPRLAALPVVVPAHELPGAEGSAGGITSEPPAPVSATRLGATGPTPELAAYARAHHAHFHEDAPRKALRLWEAYLAGFARGRFRPEAELNRAICLVRLGDLEHAHPALERLLAPGIPEHTRGQAERLLTRLGSP